MSWCRLLDLYEAVFIHWSQWSIHLQISHLDSQLLIELSQPNICASISANFGPCSPNCKVIAVNLACPSALIFCHITVADSSSLFAVHSHLAGINSSFRSTDFRASSQLTTHQYTKSYFWAQKWQVVKCEAVEQHCARGLLALYICWHVLRGINPCTIWQIHHLSSWHFTSKDQLNSLPRADEITYLTFINFQYWSSPWKFVTFSLLLLYSHFWLVEDSKSTSRWLLILLLDVYDGISILDS